MNLLNLKKEGNKICKFLIKPILIFTIEKTNTLTLIVKILRIKVHTT